MDIQRIVAYTALFLVGMMLWSEWQREQPASQPHVVSEAQRPEASVDTFAATKPSLGPVGVSAEKILNSAPGVPEKRTILVQTDLLQVAIDLHGGDVTSAKLQRYPEAHPEDEELVTLFNNQDGTRYLGQSGVVGSWGLPERIPYSSARPSYKLLETEKSLAVDLFWVGEDGLKVNKRFQFTRGKYTMGVSTHIDNGSEKIWQGKTYYQLLRQAPADNSSWLMMASYVGAALSDPANKLYEKVSFDDMLKKPIHRQQRQGWVAMQEHYFLTSWIPTDNEPHDVYTKHLKRDNLYMTGMSSQTFEIKPGQSLTNSFILYVGPQLSDTLKATAKGLELTIDYGWLWFISSCLFWLLKQVNQIINNWGWSIVMVTLIIKLVFYKLSAASYRSMAGLRQLQPKIQAMKERYGDDKQGFGQAMMELYRQEKINPLGGCLPILIQIPVFIALYWVLLESVELRQASFMWWITDLSAKDPYFVLPLLMGGTMLLQQKLSPPPPDPVQAKVMMLMPIVFTFLFLQFPSGLVLYWVANNALSILQQWYITQAFDKKSAAKKAS